MALIFPKSTDKYVRIGALIVGALALGGGAFALYVSNPYANEIRIYDGALTPAQVQADISRPVAGPTGAGPGKARTGAIVEHFRGHRPHGGG